MTSYSDVLSSTDTLRVSLVQDDSAEAPDHDGQSFVYRIDHAFDRARVTLVHEDYRQAPDPVIEDVLGEHALELDVAEEILTTEHDVVSFDYFSGYSGDNSTYVAVTTRQLATTWGFEADDMTSEPVKLSAKHALVDWRAWTEGDCWGYVIEELVTWQRTGHEDETRQTWETVDSCWGYYGTEYGTEAAREAFTAELGNRGVTA